MKLLKHDPLVGLMLCDMHNPILGLLNGFIVGGDVQLSEVVHLT